MTIASLVLGSGLDSLNVAWLFLIVEIIRLGLIDDFFHSSNVIILTLEANSGFLIAALCGERDNVDAGLAERE